VLTLSLTIIDIEMKDAMGIPRKKKNGGSRRRF
jgi:hypothetical protein